MLKTKLKDYKDKLIKYYGFSRRPNQPSELIERHQAIIVKILSKDAKNLIKGKMKDLLNRLAINNQNYENFSHEKIINSLLPTINYLDSNVSNNPNYLFILNKLKKNTLLFNDCLEELGIVFTLFDYNQDENFFAAIFNHVKKFYFKSLEEYCNKKNIQVAFFSPGKSFRGNFGLIENFLTLQHVFLFGDVVGDQVETQDNSFIVIDDMLVNLKCIKIFVIPTVMDSLPVTSIKFLIEHSSLGYFAPLEQQIKTVKKTYELTDQSRYFPLMDYVTVSSVKAKETLEKFSSILGFQKVINKNEIRANHDLIRFIPGGYPKYDSMLLQVEKYKKFKKNTIIYAPTPNDKSGNKDFWLPYMSINTHAKIILASLCEQFPDNNIVFKPHNDDFEDLISDISHFCMKYSNFRLDESGSDYFNLYANSLCMVSDFSSTAFTYAISTNCPVIFFSHNEDNLKLYEIDTYCEMREKVGVIVKNEIEMVEQIQFILKKPEFFIDKIDLVKKEYVYKMGSSSKYLAGCIESILNNEELLEWDTFAR